MRTRTSKWYECVFQYESENEKGTKRVTARMTVEALSFTEAEVVLLSKIQSFTMGECSVKAITIASYSEIFFSDVDDDKYYKVKVNFIIPDERTGREKKSKVTYLVQAGGTDDALQAAHSALAGNDYEIADVNETNIYDVVEYE